MKHPRNTSGLHRDMQKTTVASTLVASTSRPDTERRRRPDKAVFANIGVILSALLGAFLWGATGRCASPEGETGAGLDRPNIVYIMLDDAGFGDFGCYGQSKFETPNIDAMARAGIRFTQFYAGNTVCAPSRCVLMTGLHTGHCQIRGNREMGKEGQMPLAAGTNTIARVLGRSGYVCGAFGKWGLGSPGSPGDPINQGFDEFFGYNCQRQAHNYYPDHLWHNDRRIELDGRTYSHDLIVDRTLQFIRDHRNQPFFCYVPLTIPHAAMHVPEEYAAPFRKKFPEFEDTIGRYKGPEVRNPVAAFAGMMTKMDEDVGRMIRLIKELGLSERTLIMISSDNGPHHEGGHRPDFFNSSGGLRGGKRDLYEGGIRVPLIAVWPGKIRAGSETNHVAAAWDLFPTWCEVAGAPQPTELDGLSLLPALTGNEPAQPQHDSLYWEFFEQGGKRAVRFGDWKAVQLDVRKNPHGPIQLFNLSSDPVEAVDVAERHSDKVKLARRIMNESHAPSELWQWSPSRDRRP